MRNAIELKSISLNLEILEERKRQLDTQLIAVNTVIDKCKSWMNEEETIQISYAKLLILCGEIASTDSENLHSTASNSQSESSNFEATNHDADTAGYYKRRETQEELYQKLAMRLDVFEEAVSSLKSSSRFNEKQLSEVKLMCATVTRTVNDKLDKYEKETNQVMKHQSEEIKTLRKDFENVTQTLGAFSHSLMKSDDRHKNLLDTLSENFSSINDRVLKLETSADPTDGGTVQMFHSEVTQMERDVSVLESSSSHSLPTASELEKTAAELVRKELSKKLLDIEKKSGLMSTLVMKKLSNLKSLFTNTLIQQEVSDKEIEEIKFQIMNLNSEVKSLHQQSGFFAGFSTQPDNSKKQSTSCYPENCSVPSAENKKRIFPFVAPDPKIEQQLLIMDGEFDKDTGIYKIGCDGVYLVSFDLSTFNSNVELVSLGYVLRDEGVGEEKSLKLSNILCVCRNTERVSCWEIVHLVCGNEICVYADQEHDGDFTFHHFTCVRLL